MGTYLLTTSRVVVDSKMKQKSLTTISLRLTLWLDSEEDLFALLHGLHSLGKCRAEVTCSVNFVNYRMKISQS